MSFIFFVFLDLSRVHETHGCVDLSHLFGLVSAQFLLILFLLQHFELHFLHNDLMDECKRRLILARVIAGATTAAATTAATAAATAATTAAATATTATSAVIDHIDGSQLLNVESLGVNC